MNVFFEIQIVCVNNMKTTIDVKFLNNCLLEDHNFQPHLDVEVFKLFSKASTGKVSTKVTFCDATHSKNSKKVFSSFHIIALELRRDFYIFGRLRNASIIPVKLFFSKHAPKTKHSPKVPKRQYLTFSSFSNFFQRF